MPIPGYHFGGEFGFSKNFKGRFGVQGSQAEGVRETDVGFGYTIKSITLDYSIGLHALGNSTNMGLTWKFGRSVLERREENVNELVQKAFVAAQTGNYLVVQEHSYSPRSIWILPTRTFRSSSRNSRRWSPPFPAPWARKNRPR